DLAQQTVKGDVLRTAAEARAKDRGVGKRPQDHRSGAGLGRPFRCRRKQAATGERDETGKRCATRRPSRGHRLWWVPSQKGLPPVCLQPQSQTSSLAAAVNGTGVNPVPLCEPSQNGWLALRPQAHQK